MPFRKKTATIPGDSKKQAAEEGPKARKRKVSEENKWEKASIFGEEETLRELNNSFQVSEELFYREC